MFEIINHQDQSKRTLTPAEADGVRDKIVTMFGDFDQARSQQIAIYDRLKPELYLEDTPLDAPERDEKDAWKSAIKFRKLHSLFQTHQAFLWDNLYASPDAMFDVAGVDEESMHHAAAQKAALADALDKMKFSSALDRGLEFLDSTGEMCFFVSWKRVTKHVRRHKEAAETLVQNKTLTPVSQEGQFGIYEQVVYDGAAVEALNPLNVVFSPDIEPDMPESWDKGAKIIKSFETWDHVCANKLWHLTAADKRRIQGLLHPDETTDQGEDDRDLIDTVVHNGKIEVLQFWGDWTMPDGTILHNWCATVIGRRVLAAFHENPFVINPLINVALCRNIETKRGLPTLYSVYDLCLCQEQKANLENDSQALILNPPRFAPEGFFKKPETRLAPGVVLEYKKGLDDPSSIISIPVQLIKNETIITYLDATISSVSGIYPNMQGVDETRPATATEVRYKFAGQNTRVAKDLDIIKQNGILVLVEKVADLLANMKYGAETVRVTEDGVVKNIVVDDAVRGGQYRYRYTDNAGIQKKLNTNTQLISLLAQVWNDAAVPLDKVAIVRLGLENIGIENPDKYLKPVTADAAVPAALMQALSATGKTGQGNTAPVQNAAAGVPGASSVQNAAGRAPAASSVPNVNMRAPTVPAVSATAPAAGTSKTSVPGAGTGVSNAAAAAVLKALLAEALTQRSTPTAVGSDGAAGNRSALKAMSGRAPVSGGGQAGLSGALTRPAKRVGEQV